VGGSIDPIEYDVVELRELARVRGDRYVVDGFLWSELPESFPSTEGTAEYDRPATWAGSLEERQKPYLRRLPDDEEGRRVARGWVEDLVERTGSDAAAEALAYYESLGWLTEGVREGLEDYLLAVGYRSGGSVEDLTRADHVESLARTARLARLVEPDSVPEPTPGTGGGTVDGTPDAGADENTDADGIERGDDVGSDDEGPDDEESEDEDDPDESDRWWAAAVAASEAGDTDADADADADTDSGADTAPDSGFEFGTRGG